MRRIGRVVEEAIGREEVLRAARAQMVLRRWPEVVGPLLASKSIPERYERGTVWIAVLGSSWSTELRMKKDVILSRLREMSGEPALFEKLRFGVRNIDKAVVSDEPETQDDVLPGRPDLEGLSIREIGERRLKKMRDETGA